MQSVNRPKLFFIIIIHVCANRPRVLLVLVYLTAVSLGLLFFAPTSLLYFILSDWKLFLSSYQTVPDFSRFSLWTTFQ